LILRLALSTFWMSGSVNPNLFFDVTVNITFFDYFKQMARL